MGEKSSFPSSVSGTIDRLFSNIYGTLRLRPVGRVKREKKRKDGMFTMQNMKIGRAAWKEAAWVFMLSRLVMLLISTLGIVFFPQQGQLASTNCFSHPAGCLG